NRKPTHRRGRVALIDAREMGTMMGESLGDKRKELTQRAIDEIVNLFTDGAAARETAGYDAPRGSATELDSGSNTDVSGDGGGPAGTDSRVKVLRNQDFGYARLTVELPLRPVWVMDQALPTLTGVIAEVCAGFA